jgi:hypothetical protein
MAPRYYEDPGADKLLYWNNTTNFYGNATIGTSLTFSFGTLAVSQVNLANNVTGNLPVTNLNSGTLATNTTFWRGDGTWATPSATSVTSWDTIGDAAGNGNIALLNTQQSWTSTLDNGTVLGIVNTDTDAAADTTLFGLYHYDGDDANVIYFSATGDSDGSPDIDYVFSQTSAIIRPVLVMGTNSVTVTNAFGNVLANAVVFTDSADYFTGTDGETILQEVGATNDAQDASITGNSASIATHETRIDALETDDIASTRITQSQTTWTDTPTITLASDVQGLVIKGNAATAKTFTLPQGIAANVGFSFANIGTVVGATWTATSDGTSSIVGQPTFLPGANGYVLSEGSNVWRCYQGPALIQSFSISFDPDAVCDGAVDRLFLMPVSSSAFPSGLKVLTWSVSFEADPTTEVDLDLKRADAFIGVANSAVMDVLDTTAGASSETTTANINADAAVAVGKVLYLEFGTAYTETTHQINFSMTYQAQ